MARTLFADKGRSIPDICKTLDVSRSTLYRYVAEEEAQESNVSKS
jgi:predicted transcriptional regulator YheO